MFRHRTRDEIEGPLQLQMATLDYSSYVGRIGIGRIQRGRLKPAQQITGVYGLPDAEGKFEHGSPKTAKVNQVFGFPRYRTGFAGRSRGRRHRAGDWYRRAVDRLHDH